MENFLFFKFLLFIFFLNIISSYETRNGYVIMKYPITLSNVEELYTSNYEIPMQTPIVDYGKEFIILEKNKLTQTRIKNSFLGGTYKDYNILFSDYSKNYEIKPLNYFKLEYFFSQNCNIYIFEYYQEPKLKWGHHRLKINLNELKKYGECYQNLDVSDSDSGVFAVYNDKNNLISAVKYQIYQNLIQSICTVAMESNIVQALVHSYYEKGAFSDGYSLKYTLLIGIDQSGQINIWNIQGAYSFLDSFSNNRLIKNFKFDNFIFKTGGRVAETISWYGFSKKLLYINNYNLILIDLQDLEIKVKKKVKFYGTSLLMFQEQMKQGLIGTSDGYIYLITVGESDISINDKYKICPGTTVKSISNNKTSPTNLDITYLFIVNCGYYKIFQLKKPKKVGDL